MNPGTHNDIPQAGVFDVINESRQPCGSPREFIVRKIDQWSKKVSSSNLQIRVGFSKGIFPHFEFLEIDINRGDKVSGERSGGRQGGLCQLRAGVAQLVLHLEVEAREARCTRQIEHVGFHEACKFSSPVESPSGKIGRRSKSATLPADQTSLKSRTGLEIEGVLVPPAIDHRILVHLGKDHFVVAHDRSEIDDRKRHVGDRADAQLYIIRIVRGGKVEIQLLIHCPEVQHQRCVFFLHLRGIDRELVLEIPSDHIGNRDRLSHRINLFGTTPVVVAENKAVCTGADFDLIDVFKVTACCDDRVGTLDRHLDLGRDYITVVVLGPIGSDFDLQEFR